MARTQVGIVGAGPAGLVLSHLLAQAGIECVLLEKHARAHIEQRVRAGLIEHRTVEFLKERGLGERMLREGMVHRGTEFRVFGERHRIPYSDLYGGRCMLVYPQQELVADLVRLRLEQGGEIVFDAADVALQGIDSVTPAITWDDSGGRLECDFIAGCDGFHGVSRDSIPPGALTLHDQPLPFGWLGIIAAVPPSTTEIIYAHHERGFAGHMLRTATVSRFYLQCDPDDDITNWPDERIWEELRVRLATRDGWTLQEGPILEKSISELRSFVCEPMRFARLFLAGDAAHIVPPTGAKGMNLAIFDAGVLAEALISWYRDGDESGLNAYSDTCLRRAWRVQEFSTWMSWMLHRLPDDMPGVEFRRKLQRAQLEYVCTSPAAGASFAENYVGIEGF
ncbi:MAG: 4-hydroxybenzoate 3-monooxygenase [Tepidiformaceae bacterium]